MDKLMEIQHELIKKEELDLVGIETYITIRIEAMEGSFEVFYDWADGEFYNVEYLGDDGKVCIDKDEYPELYGYLISTARGMGIDDPDALSMLVIDKPEE